MRGPYRRRRVHLPPNFQNFKPSGVPRKFLKSVALTVDEYEAIRLADYQGLEHVQAAEQMDISRPTFTRLIEKARHKIASVLVEGMELIIEGGNVEFINSLRRCRNCGDEHIEPTGTELDDCANCGSENIDDLNRNFVKKKNNEKSNRRAGRH